MAISTSTGFNSGSGRGNQELEVYFHPEQLKYIEKVFPEIHFPPDVSEEALRHYNGQRSIIHFIRTKTRR